MRFGTWLALLAIALLAGCTRPAPWGLEGGEGEACFPDETCDPGLACQVGVCVTGEPADGGVDLRRDGKLKVDLRRDQAPGCVPPPTPTVINPPKTTTAKSVALKGTAPKATEVSVMGGSGVVTAKVVAGLFCIVVPLLENNVNKLIVSSSSGKGCSSPTVELSVGQVAPGPVNYAWGKLAATAAQPAVGLVSWVTDGQTGQLVRFSFADPEVSAGTCDYNEYLWLDLGAQQILQQLVVKYPKKSGFKNYLDCWKLVVSNKIAPSAPDANHPDWKVIAKGETGAGTPSDLYVQLGGVQARHAALIMYEDGGTGYYETFEIAEVELWGNEQEPPGATCP